MKRRIRSTATAMLMLWAAHTTAARVDVQLDHQLPAAGVRDLTLFLPLGYNAVRTALHLTAQLGRAPIGFEMLPEPTPSQGVEPDRPASPRRFSLNGLTVREALDAIVREDQRYEWREANGVLHIAPRRASTNALNVLNRPLPARAFRRVTLAGALDQIHQAIDPNYDPAATITLRTGPESSRESQAQQARTFDAVASGTVRDELDTVIHAHRDAYWFVEYTGEIADLQHARVGLCVFAGRCVVWAGTAGSVR